MPTTTVTTDTRAELVTDATYLAFICNRPGSIGGHTFGIVSGEQAAQMFAISLRPELLVFTLCR